MIDYIQSFVSKWSNCLYNKSIVSSFSTFNSPTPCSHSILHWQEALVQCWMSAVIMNSRVLQLNSMQCFWCFIMKNRNWCRFLVDSLYQIEKILPICNLPGVFIMKIYQVHFQHQLRQAFFLFLSFLIALIDFLRF